MVNFTLPKSGMLPKNLLLCRLQKTFRHQFKQQNMTGQKRYFIGCFILLFFGIQQIALAQLDRKLSKKALKVIALNKQAETEQSPELLLKAIKILLKENQIRPLQAEDTPSLGVQEVDIFNLNVLYNRAWAMAESQGASPSLRAKFAQIELAVEAREHLLKTLALQPNGIEGKTYKLQALKSQKMDIDFDEGHQVEFLLEIGSNFSLEMFRAGQRLVVEMESIGEQNIYYYEIKNTGTHQIVITNKRKQEESCDFLQSVK